MTGAVDVTPQDVTGFWLGEIGQERWFAADPALDREIVARFGAVCGVATRGGLVAWSATDLGTLARVILLDQFPRNMHRGTARAYASEPLARAVAKAAVAAGVDLRLTDETARQLIYLPLMHSESLADQNLCAALVATRMPETGAECLEHAGKHRAVIRRFGRFPSRNRALGRADTAAELQYRAEGGYMG